MKTGTPVFDGIALAKLEATLTGPTPQLNSVMAFVSTLTGKTYGSGTYNNIWSKRTLELLEELRESMEEDAARVCMEGGQSGPTQKSGVQFGGGGLGDHLAGDKDAPSI